MNTKLAERIFQPRNAGTFTSEEAKERGMFLAVGTAGEWAEQGRVSLFLLVDEADGVVAEAVFQVFGPPFLIGAAEAACEVLLRKNYDQARRIGWELLDKQMQDKTHKPAFPQEASASLNLVLEAIEHAAEACVGIPLAAEYVATPLFTESEGERTYPNLSLLTHVEKLALIEEVIAKEIRPYVELDAGGVQIVELKNDQEVVIAYSGSCTTCYSATGSTLSAIQSILRAHIHPDMQVIPKL